MSPPSSNPCLVEKNISTSDSSGTVGVTGLCFSTLYSFNKLAEDMVFAGGGGFFLSPASSLLSPRDLVPRLTSVLGVAVLRSVSLLIVA